MASNDKIIEQLRTEIEQLRAEIAQLRVRAEAAEARADAAEARANAAERKVIQRVLPGAIAYALAEEARYRRSMLTGRCGVVAGW
jgi:phage shock protein A